METRPYLFFDGRCEEAIEFYKKAAGAEVTALLRFKDAPEPHQPGMIPPGAENKVMHSEIRIAGSTVMASDGRCLGKPNFEGFALAILVKTPAEAEKTFKAMSDGGQVQMPLEKTFFSPAFGMLRDKFGMNWMVVSDQ
ncbi:MAG: VOC family protein [Dongiaceae bacterium]